MIRKISVNQLRPGMFVVDLHKRWIEHSLWRSRFMVRDSEQVIRLIEDGIAEVSIDTQKGIDIPPPVRKPEEFESHFRSLAEIKAATPHVVSLEEERRRSHSLLGEASQVVNQLIQSVRLGYRADADRLEPLIGRMIESVARNPDALVPMARQKSKENYAADHAVATAALIVALGRQLNIDPLEQERLALGALLKDIGEAAIDAKVIDKPGMLSRAEYSIIQSHVEEGLALLEGSGRLSDTSLQVVHDHHERFDGEGYPYKSAGDQISLAGRMAAIVDTYDAMTSDRPYRAAISPSLALRQLYGEAGRQFDPELITTFVRTVGIYPIGTLVLLESGHLAVVDQVHPQNLLSPVVKVIYHSGHRQYVSPVVVDLARKIGNHYGQIVRAESYERWGINPQRWQPG